MKTIGRIHSLWRYPVKSMRGEEIAEAFCGFSGIYGDRIFALTSSAAAAGFPFLTCREHGQMIRYQPRFQSPEKAARPPNLLEAQKLGPGVTPMYASSADLTVDVQSPDGEVLAIDDPGLITLLRSHMPQAPELNLVRSDRAMTDCRPLSIISMQTIRQLGDELGAQVDARRFRANLYIDLDSGDGFAEQALVNRSLRVGGKAVVWVLQRDTRCKMITIDPATGESDPQVLRHLAQNHQATAGVYCAVLVEGMLHPGDPVELLD
jgi:uncharacterized protein YcbX